MWMVFNFDRGVDMDYQRVATTKIAALAGPWPEYYYA